MTEIGLSLITGLSIGFLGSFHCLGMCGPIALSLPLHTQTGFRKYASIGLYNIGRAITYAALGFIFGLLGHQFRLWGLQQILSIAAGTLILLFLFSRFSITSRIGWLNRLNHWVQQSLSRVLQSPKHPGSFFTIGLLNGLLPCGLVYVAIAAAAVTASISSGTLLMFAFGLGTIPVMAGLMLFGHLISSSVRYTINRTVPYFVGIMALILILRGLNLGIPYLSPRLESGSQNVECCHKPG